MLLDFSISFFILPTFYLILIIYIGRFVEKTLLTTNLMMRQTVMLFKSPENTTDTEDDYTDIDEEIGFCQRLKFLSPKSIKQDNCKNKTHCAIREIFNFKAEVVEEEKAKNKKVSTEKRKQ